MSHPSVIKQQHGDAVAEHTAKQILLRIQDLFLATLFYANQVAQQELFGCSLPQRIALEQKYGYTSDQDLLRALVGDAASQIGIELQEYPGGITDAPIQLPSFDLLYDKLLTLSENATWIPQENP